MGIKFSNNASSNITHDLTADATSVSVTPGTGDLFPSIVEGKDYFYATLAGNNGLEIVKVTRRVLDTMTIERAQDSTVSLSFNQGDLFELRIVAADFEDTFSHIETTLEDTVDALNTSVDNKMSSYLPLSGGTMTGRLMSSQNDSGTLSAASDDGQVRICGGTGGWSNGGIGIFYGKDSTNYPSGWSLVSFKPGTDSSIGFRGYYDVVNSKHRLTWNDNDILTSAGGSLNGTILYDGTSGIIAQHKMNTGQIRIYGGNGYGYGGYLNLSGSERSTNPGGFSLVAYAGGPFCSLEGTTEGTLKWRGDEIITDAGGTLQGPIIFDQNVDVEIYKNTDSSSLIMRGGTSGYTSSGSVYLYGKDHPDTPGNVALYARDGVNSTAFIMTPDGNVTVNNKKVLTEAGGTMTGGIIFDGVSYAISQKAGSTTPVRIMTSTSASDDGACITLFPKNYEDASFASAIWLKTELNNVSKSWYFYADGRLQAPGSLFYAFQPVSSAKVGQWVHLTANRNAALVLPSGGTWAYYAHWMADTSGKVPETFGSVGVSAGGTQIFSANAQYKSQGFAWRIA